MIITFILSAILGSVIMPGLKNFLGDLMTLKIACMTLSAGMVLCALTIRSPDQILLFYVYTGCWGVLFGIVVPSGRVVFVNIMPKGQESEMMGIYLFSANGFVWLPPLILTVLNEAGIGINDGILAVAGLG